MCLVYNYIYSFLAIPKRVRSRGGRGGGAARHVGQSPNAHKVLIYHIFDDSDTQTKVLCMNSTVVRMIEMTGCFFQPRLIAVFS